MAIASNILVIDDDPAIREACSAVFYEEEYSVQTADNGQTGLQIIREQNIDLVLLDLKMPGIGGMDLLKIIREEDPEIVVIIITGYGTIESAVNAVKLGAFDFLAKPFTPDLLRVSVKRCLSVRRLSRQNRLLKEELNRSCDYLEGINYILGNSDSTVQIRNIIRKVAKTDSTVLILGETGTGKEMVAKAIHQSSERLQGPMLVVDCGALVESLFESELFGHVKGSFTGAITTKHGRFELANGGTLFFDEIGNIGPKIQATLLRAIQERVIFRVGSSRPIKVDVRLIAATNKDIMADIHNGKFREDLFYRLSVVPISIPPLRERVPDIPILAEYFLRKYNERRKKNVKSMSKRALKALMAYDWPGNVRELESVIERAVVLTDNEVLQPYDLMFFGQSEKPGLLPPRPALHSLQEMEAEHIQYVLKLTKGQISRAAEILGVDRKTLRTKIKKYEIN
jgi:two-component system response regulator HydG